MKLTRWDPFREFENMNSRWNQLLNLPALSPRETEAVFDWTPAVDVEETEKEYTVKADLPEVKKADMKIGIEDGVLSLEGERRQEKEEKTKKFHRTERVYGKFVRRMTVPSDVDPQKVNAEFKDGVLLVHMPKNESAKPKSIEVKVA